MEVCQHCFKNERLQNMILNPGVPGILGDCPTCGTPDSKVIDAVELANAFEPLLGIYEKTQYGEHYIDAGEGDVYEVERDYLEELLAQDWTIFSEPFDTTKISAFLSYIDDEYEDDTMYAMYELADRAPDDDFASLAYHIMHDRRYFPKEDIDTPCLDTILESYLEFFLSVDPKDKIWYGVKKQERSISGIIPEPLQNDQMGAPPPYDIVCAGRANPAGISYLELYSDKETAMLEARCEHGDFVCIGEFIIPSGLRLINLTPALHDLDPFAYSSSYHLKKAFESRLLLRKFASWLSRPVRDADHELDYVVTQYLTEFIRHHEYAGIYYKSSMFSGTNLVLFEPDDYHCRSVQQYEIPAVRIIYDQPKEVTEAYRAQLIDRLPW